MKTIISHSESFACDGNLIERWATVIRDSLRFVKTHMRKSGIMAAVLAVSLALATTTTSSAQTVDDNTLEEQFSSAAKEFQVPKEVLISIAYNQSQWRAHGKGSNTDRGHGPIDMHSHRNDRANECDHNKKDRVDPNADTLDVASKLTGQSADTVKGDTKQNIRGAAAVLEIYAKEVNNGSLPGSTDKWCAVVAKFSAFVDQETANKFADAVYDAIKNGIPNVTIDGQVVGLPADTSVTVKS
jgi:hypothetical protein